MRLQDWKSYKIRIRPFSDIMHHIMYTYLRRASIIYRPFQFITLQGNIWYNQNTITSNQSRVTNYFSICNY